MGDLYPSSSLKKFLPYKWRNCGEKKIVVLSISASILGYCFVCFLFSKEQFSSNLSNEEGFSITSCERSFSKLKLIENMYKIIYDTGTPNKFGFNQHRKRIPFSRCEK